MAVWPRCGDPERLAAWCLSTISINENNYTAPVETSTGAVCMNDNNPLLPCYERFISKNASARPPSLTFTVVGRKDPAEPRPGPKNKGLDLWRYEGGTAGLIPVVGQGLVGGSVSHDPGVSSRDDGRGTTGIPIPEPAAEGNVGTGVGRKEGQERACKQTGVWGRIAVEVRKQCGFGQTMRRMWIATS